MQLADVKSLVETAWKHAESHRVMEKEGCKKHPQDEKRRMKKEHLERLCYHLGWADLFLREMIEEDIKEGFDKEVD